MSRRDSLQHGLMRARRDSWTIIEPTSREIQIDLDGLRALRVFARQFAMLDARGLTARWKTQIVPSTTPNHCHLTITLPRPRPLRDRVLLAALLGSDLKREAFNYIRVIRRRRIPVAFFRRTLCPPSRPRAKKSKQSPTT